LVVLHSSTSFTSWLFGWLFGWLVGLFGLLVGLLFGWLVVLSTWIDKNHLVSCFHNVSV